MDNLNAKAMKQVTGTPQALNVSADFLQAIGIWDFSCPEITWAMEITAIIDNGKVIINGMEPNYAAVLKVKELLK